MIKPLEEYLFPLSLLVVSKILSRTDNIKKLKISVLNFPERFEDTAHFIYIIGTFITPLQPSLRGRRVYFLEFAISCIYGSQSPSYTWIYDTDYTSIPTLRANLKSEVVR